MMGSLGRRLACFAAVVALTVVALMAALVSSAPGATSADVELTGVPGLTAVTYGQTAAYVARITNTGNVTLKNVTFHNPIPTTDVDGQPQQAVFQSSSCAGGTLTATEFTCLVDDRLRAGESLMLTIAWKTPSAGSSPGCPSSPCMTNSAFWSTGIADPRTFTMAPVATELLSGADDSKAGTYALAACTDPSSPTVATNPAVNLANPLATSVCAPNLPVSNPLHPGLVTWVEERDHAPSDPGVTQVSDVCIPAPGSECDQAPFVFSSFATFTFVIANASLPAGETIDKVFHDGALVSTSRRADPHVFSIKNEKFKGITTVVVRSTTNGQWTFG